jgi:hypothetical protein
MTGSILSRLSQNLLNFSIKLLNLFDFNLLNRKKLFSFLSYSSYIVASEKSFKYYFSYLYRAWLLVDLHILAAFLSLSIKFRDLMRIFSFFILSELKTNNLFFISIFFSIVLSDSLEIF